MKVCNECRNQLSILGRYIHPIKGKKFTVCGSCYKRLDNLIEQWRTFVFTHPKTIDSLNINGTELKYNFEKKVNKIMKNYELYSINNHFIHYDKSIDTQPNIDNKNINYRMVNITGGL